MAAKYGSWQPWIDATAKSLEANNGLESSFAESMAIFLAYCTAYSLNPRVTSGWRDPAYQKALRARWDAGDRVGLRARPAVDSLHSRTSWLGSPAAVACDVVTSNDGTAAKIARALGLGVGADFSTPDPGHYFKK